MSSLIDWTASQISGLYAPQHTSGANAAQLTKTPLDLSAFAPDAEIHLNHTRVDLDKYREFVESQRAGATEVECKPEDLIETPVEEGNPEAGSIVAGKATLVRTYPFLLRAAPMQTSTVISFSAKILNKDSKPQIVQLFQTTADKPVQVNLQTPHSVDASAL
ncbi:hypothetical protein MVEN_02581700 [Mycena venus]|uniref:Uncharacterized protein n=1 Tax=Mycena venus TaxID=2733690 RepID=A0A8H6TWT7_9AGAR|nr:hypothetical protein MVEN_02581700 [Mycena venus]